MLPRWETWKKELVEVERERGFPGLSWLSGEISTGDDILGLLELDTAIEWRYSQ